MCLVPDEWTSSSHDDAVRCQRDGVVADKHQVGVARPPPRSAHLVQDAGVVLPVRKSQQALAHHSSTVTNRIHLLKIIEASRWM